MNSNKSEAPEGKSHQVFFGDRIVESTQKAHLVRDLFEGVAEHYDLMNDLMSAGIHRRWKQAMVDALNPHQPLTMTDVAGGTGDIAFRVWNRLSKDIKPPRANHITVCDFTEGMVFRGRDRALNEGIAQGIDFIVADAESLPLPDGSQDVVTNAFGIRNITNPAHAFNEARRVLRRGGRLLCLEFGGPVSSGIKPFYEAYASKILPIIGMAIAGNSSAYRYLAESIDRFPDREVVSKWIEGAGFSRVRSRALSGGIATLYSAWRL